MIPASEVQPWSKKTVAQMWGMVANVLYHSCSPTAQHHTCWINIKWRWCVMWLSYVFNFSVSWEVYKQVDCLFRESEVYNLFCFCVVLFRLWQPTATYDFSFICALPFSVLNEHNWSLIYYLKWFLRSPLQTGLCTLCNQKGKKRAIPHLTFYPWNFLHFLLRYILRLVSVP